MQAKTAGRSPREMAEQKYASARSNLLLMLILTVVNIVLYVCGSYTMFLFSATVPYLMVVCSTIFFDMPALMIICIGIAAVILIVYLLCWIFSKKHYGWMIGALVLFSLDILAMVGMFLVSPELFSILAALWHVWVLYYLITGVTNGVKLKKMPVSEPISAQAEEIPEAEAQTEDTRALRRADTEVKARILLEADAMGRHIVYRRVKRTNELVINGYVYDEVEMLIESAHALTANLDGHTFVVGCDGSHSYLEADGALVARKLRLW